jgi:phosphoglycolate phosphatase-like HAD superfamily hydrolase
LAGLRGGGAVITIALLDRLRYRAGIFDVRGTLLELDPRYRDIIHLKIIRDYGRRSGNRYLMSFDESDLQQLLGMSPTKRAQALERFGIDQETFDQGWVSEEAMAIRMKNSYIQPDAQYLQRLKKLGVKLGVVTSAVKRAADVDIGIIKGKIGSRIFDEVVMASYEPALSQKPDPGSVIACMERLSSRPEVTFGVGNSGRDIEAYKAAGIFDVLIDRGDRGYDGPEPSMRITSLGDLPAFVVERGSLSRLLGRG